MNTPKYTIIPKPSRHRRNLIRKIEREADRKAAERLELDQLDKIRQTKQI